MMVPLYHLQSSETGAYCSGVNGKLSLGEILVDSAVQKIVKSGSCVNEPFVSGLGQWNETLDDVHVCLELIYVQINHHTNIAPAAAQSVMDKSMINLLHSMFFDF